jgi:tRNA threonylcarbamoyladenosine modification (KEOPS) complex  Pcc1 subunit
MCNFLTANINPQFKSNRSNLELQSELKSPLQITKSINPKLKTKPIENSETSITMKKSNKIYNFYELNELEEVLFNKNGKYFLKYSVFFLNIFLIGIISINHKEKINKEFNIDINGFLYFFICNLIGNFISLMVKNLYVIIILSILSPISIYSVNKKLLDNLSDKISIGNNLLLYSICFLYTNISLRISSETIKNINEKSRVKLKKEKKILQELMTENNSLAI